MSWFLIIQLNLLNCMKFLLRKQQLAPGTKNSRPKQYPTNLISWNRWNMVLTYRIKMGLACSQKHRYAISIRRFYSSFRRFYSHIKKLLFPSISFYFGTSIRNRSWLEEKSACGFYWVWWINELIHVFTLNLIPFHITNI